MNSVQSHAQPVAAVIGHRNEEVAARQTVRAPIDIDLHTVMARLSDGTLYFPEHDHPLSFARVVDDITTGQIERPVCVFAFNVAEGWSRDVSEDVARAVAAKVRDRGFAPQESLGEWIEEQTGITFRYLEAAE